MQQILDQIRAVFNVGETKLTKKQILILKYISDNIEEASYLTIRKLCSNIGCSQATMMRLCRELGYDSFIAFREGLRKKKSMGIKPDDVIVKSQKEELFDEVLRNEKKLLERFIDSVSRADVDACARKIVEADFVLILGSGISGIIGQALSFRLTQCSVQNTVVDPYKDWKRARQLLALTTHRSVVLGISYPMYNFDQAQAVRIANMGGAYTIGITDTMKAPIAEVAAMTLICPLSGENIFNSFVTPLEMVNLLIHSIIIKLGMTYKNIKLDN
ncbi:MAG: MurR/RpiR family transcriptional regulator [Clostridiaceae bacterium]|nr:MurR/RpiR family transcriptional regulator [Clostridiaceae bacterium]